MMQVRASIQAERNGRVYMIFSERGTFYWARSTPGSYMHGPFQTMQGVYIDLETHEGKTAQHWQKVFALFYPTLGDVSPNQLSV